MIFWEKTYIFIKIANNDKVCWCIHNVRTWRKCFTLVDYLPFLDDHQNNKKFGEEDHFRYGVSDLYLLMALVQVNEGSSDVSFSISIKCILYTSGQNFGHDSKINWTGEKQCVSSSRKKVIILLYVETCQVKSPRQFWNLRDLTWRVSIHILKFEGQKYVASKFRNWMFLWKC